MRQMTTSTARSGTRPRRAAPSGYPVLASKITPPALPGWVISRSRLTDRIAAGAAMPLTILTGPPGAGKTTALASWAAAGTAPGRVAWVTLDDYDNRPGSFWSYLAEALRQAGVAVPGRMPPPSRGGAIDRTFLLEMASVLAAQDPPLILVLDDLHLITAPGPLQELAHLLRYARSGLHLIAAARADPLLPLHRYRVAGGLTEIRAAELSFTGPEAAQLMAQHGITLPAETLDLITRRQEGWAAGLRLTALSLDNHPDPALFIKNLMVDDSAITGYLVAEVLDAQAAATRDLMLKTSILNQVNADLACELTGDPQAASALTALARSNAFVQPLGRGWYRYHSLLAAVLRLKLRRESPGRVHGLHRDAARWYQRNGLPGEAATHAAAISDWPLAAQIAVDELATGDLLQPGGSSPLADCLRQMPDPPPPDGPPQPQSLLAAAARHLSGGRDQACAALLDAAELLLGKLPGDQAITSRLAAALIRVAVARRSGDFGAARPAAAQAQVLFDQLPDGLRARHPQARAQILSARGTVALWSGDFAAATAAFSAAEAAAPEVSQERADCLGHLALIEGLHGHLNRAAELAASGTMPQADHPAGYLVPAAAAALALVHLQRNEPAAWQRKLKEADTALQAHPDRLICALACLVAARGAHAQGRGPAAADLLQRARHGWSPPPWLDHLFNIVESHAHATAGDIQAALDAAGRASISSALDVSVARARAWLTAGNIQAARRALADAADDPSDSGIRLEAHLAEALISYRSGNSAQGRLSLERAVRLGEPEGCRLPFSRDSTWIQPALRHDPDLAQTCRWLLPPGQLPHCSTSASPAATMRPAPVIIQDLTDREREVLQHVSSMLTTAEIASELCISVNTAKTHLRSIYQKLGAAGRGEAVRRARRLRIII
jgi:LuxR family transcriptional regulator, maltose regulon positive regulatory protein